MLRSRLPRRGEVGFVEAVVGRVVAFAERTPVLLDVLDTIRDRTRLDLQAGSELSICHYRTHRLLTLKGPARAFISADGVAAENSKPVVASGGTCTTPVVSNFQGGLVTRGLARRQSEPKAPMTSAAPKSSAASARIESRALIRLPQGGSCEESPPVVSRGIAIVLWKALRNARRRASDQAYFNPLPPARQANSKTLHLSMRKKLFRGHVYDEGRPQSRHQHTLHAQQLRAPGRSADSRPLSCPSKMLGDFERLCQSRLALDDVLLDR